MVVSISEADVRVQIDVKPRLQSGQMVPGTVGGGPSISTHGERAKREREKSEGRRERKLEKRGGNSHLQLPNSKHIKLPPQQLQV